jgi:hypothetical protein
MAPFDHVRMEIRDAIYDSHGVRLLVQFNAAFAAKKMYPVGGALS